jgi:hypothetical protein
MKWNELLGQIEAARKNWEIIRSDTGAEKEAQAFLKDSYLVLSNEYSQAGLSNFEGEVYRGEVIKYNFLKNTPSSNEFIKLSQAVRNIQGQLKGLFQRTAEYKKTQAALDAAEKKLKKFDFSTLEFLDDIMVELRFPTLKIEVIQKIKTHSLVDAEQTSLSKASTRVVIKSIFNNNG